MKVYLASRFSRGEEMNRCAADLRQADEAHIDVTSRWHSDLSHRMKWRGPETAHADFNARLAREDVADLLAADVVVSFTEGPAGGGRGGRHVEFGIALAAGKRVVVVGPREHVFHWLPAVEHFSTWPDAVESLAYDARAEPFRFIDVLLSLWRRCR